MFDNIEIFKGKNLSSLFEDIYNNSLQKEKQIKKLILELEPFIKSIGDATIIVPIIKEYMEIAIKNDEQLIKMAAIIQRACLNKDNSSEITLTDNEKEQLLKNVKDIQNKNKDIIDNYIDKTKNKVINISGQ